MPAKEEPHHRLFVAIEPPEAVREVLSALPERLRGVHWTPPHQYHLTLRFIGEVPASQVGRIREALGKVRVEPFLLPLAGVGRFPPRGRPRVLWAGTGSGDPRLFQLRQQVDDALLACGLDLDVRSFQPHFTLGRCNREARESALAAFLRAREGFAGPLFRVREFVLFESELLASGARHTPLERYPLREDGARELC